ncbi:hypothetical protein RI367_007682 [Sorochytrium milnesiophthora]
MKISMSLAFLVAAALVSMITVSVHAAPAAVSSSAPDVADDLHTEVTMSASPLYKRHSIIIRRRYRFKKVTTTTSANTGSTPSTSQSSNDGSGSASGEVSTPPASTTPAYGGSGVAANELNFGETTGAQLPLVNQIRAMVGAPPLTYSSLLEIACQKHAQDMATHEVMSHTGSDGSQPWDRATQVGYKWSAVAENIAVGQKNVGEVMTAWDHSPGHFSNIISTSVTQFSCGEATGADGKIYWAQCFAAPL